MKKIFSETIEVDGQKSNLVASIIIRGKNEAKWLKILLPKLKKQSINNFEIIFCDNGSKDNTLELLRKNNIKKFINLNITYLEKF